MNPSADRIIELIIKRLNGQLNEAEDIELQDWINLSEDNRLAVEDFLDEDKLRRGVRDLYEVRGRVWLRLQAQVPGKRMAPVRSLLKYAAAAAIIISIVTASYYLLVNRVQNATTISAVDTLQHHLSPDIAPGSDKATLTLTNGSVIILDSAAKGMLTRQSNTLVVKSTDGQVTYKPENSSQPVATSIAYNTLATPRGGQYQLQLPDGSKVWLNAVSSLRFPVAFAGSERRVQLTGEAYFEIAKNAESPFKVTILSSSGENEGEVEVIGTHFNINAYNDEPVIKTTLLEGKVRVSVTERQTSNVKPQTLTPGQQASIVDHTLSIIQNADVEAAVAWKNGLFQLTSADIQTIMRQVERWYNVEVVYEGAIPTGHITGKVSRNMRLSNVLKVLELSGIHFRIEGRKVIVLP